MSDYIPVGGYGGLQQSQGRPQVKSVYYPPQQQPSQQQLNQCPQGSSQLPSGAAVPVINMIQTPPGVTLLSFQQDVSATVPPELQQQLKQLQQQQQPQQLPPQNNNVPTYVSSDYAATGWETAYRTTPVRVINLPQQQQQQAGGQQGAGLIPNIALEAARSEYEQAVAQAQRAAERLGQISGVQPQVQFSGFSQASGQQGFGGGLPSGQQGFGGGGLPSGQQGFGGGFNPQQQQGGYGGGLNAQQQQCQGQQQQCPLQPQKQVQFSGVQQQRRLTPTNSSYNFEQSGPAGGRTFNQAQNESVYIGMPNNLYLASNRPRDYHFQPQRQESNTNLLRTARESSSGTKLRASQSDENIRTAVLNEEGKVVGVVETRYNQPSQGQQVAAGSSSDYHFDALRGLNSAY